MINFSCTKKHSPEYQLRGGILYHLRINILALCVIPKRG
nr:MAG TPA: hypothetical protein [Caudoviricetes sp.]